MMAPPWWLCRQGGIHLIYKNPPLLKTYSDLIPQAPRKQIKPS